MSDQPIILRRDPGRDSTASEIARSRGEFRRQPHLTAEPAPVAATPPIKRAKSAPKAPQQRSGRLLH
ncbi:MAG: hypothetical protein QOG33_1760 [Gaiellales bacterium]|jgi:hypothetical protein|nr:hypothetical protein [Gaiellales bacterium]